MDTEDLSFAEGSLAMRGLTLEEVEFPGLLADVTSEKLSWKTARHCSTHGYPTPDGYWLRLALSL